MIISARLVRARKTFVCADCGKPIRPKDRYLRLYGAADECDQPNVLRLHPKCNEWPHPKILNALA